ncbi:hypothetical protein H2248_000002 [Termitomyces sp. 'cryptogamus']|nr:hypothetical protein H2248_000002 [Termitomyces sp. 'cryptogamus']
MLLEDPGKRMRKWFRSSRDVLIVAATAHNKVLHVHGSLEGLLLIFDLPCVFTQQLQLSQATISLQKLESQGGSILAKLLPPKSNMSTDIDSLRLQDDVMTWLAIDKGRYIVFASFTLIVYEYFITLDDEVKYFWSGRWTPSRILYLVNRYLPPIIMACDRAIRAIFGLSTVALFTIQGILVARVFYLFEHSRTARLIIAITYGAAIIATITTLVLVMVDAMLLKPLSTLSQVVDLVGCPIRPQTTFWRIYISAFALHTVLYIFTLVRVRNCENSLQAPLIKRLHRDGGLFYLVVIGAVGYTEIGSGLIHHPAINIPANFANLLLAATSVSISRVMLSFHDLAEFLRNNPGRLGHVNAIPMNHVNWRKGSRDGEYLVTGNDHTGIVSHAEFLHDMVMDQ